MVAPYLSTYVEKSLKFGPPNASVTRFRYRRYGVNQAKPFVHTPLQIYIEETLKGTQYATSAGGDIDSGVLTAATNMARGRFVGQLGESSQFGSTITAERKATYDTVVGGIISALKSARAVKRGRLVEAAHLLGISPPEVRRTLKTRKTKGQRIRRVTITRYRLPDGREVAKSIGNKWLWWSYGVKPLLGDVFNGVDVLQRPMPWMRIRGSGSSKSSRNTVQKLYSDYYRKYYFVGQRIEDDCKVAIAANVRVKNPNLWLANQLGLVNPVQMFNEGIPFSFVIDWFSNLSQVISQMTDFVGLEIEEPVTSTRQTNSFEMVNSLSPEAEYIVRWSALKRELIIPSAKLRFAYERFQWQRGANAVSLLVQFLKSNKK